MQANESDVARREDRKIVKPVAKGQTPLRENGSQSGEGISLIHSFLFVFAVELYECLFSFTLF